MAKMTYDENGNAVDYLAERNEEIKSNLKGRIDILIEEQELDKKRQAQVRISRNDAD